MATETNPLSVKTRLSSYVVTHFRPARYWTLRRRFLRESGWHASAGANQSVDAAGEPLPWYTYATTAFLAPRLDDQMKVFEYGSGNSTRWWAGRVATVVAVEDDRAWFDRVSAEMPANVDLRFVSSADDGYARESTAEGRPYDVVIIDGSDRNGCAKHAITSLKKDGVVVWDNADWTHMFQEGMDVLEAAGFRRLDFHGLGPLNGYGWITTVFYRPKNCLGL